MSENCDLAETGQLGDAEGLRASSERREKRSLLFDGFPEKMADDFFWLLIISAIWKKKQMHKPCAHNIFLLYNENLCNIEETVCALAVFLIK